MAEHHQQPPLDDYLHRIIFLVAQPIDLLRSDPEGIEQTVRHLTATATYFNVLTVSQFGGRLGPERERGLTEQVVAAAFQTFAGHDPPPESFDKAAMLLRGITQGHPFNDGNKRTGFLLASYYLQRLGIPLPQPFPEEVIVSFCQDLSAGKLRELYQIKDELRAIYELP